MGLSIGYVLTQDRGGPVDLTVALAREIRSRAAVDRVVVLGPAPVTSAGELGDLHVDVVMSSKTDRHGRRKLLDALHEQRLDVVHAQDRRAALAVAPLARRTTVLATYHGVPERVPASWAAGVAEAPRPPARDLAVLAADAVVGRRMAMTVAPSSAIAATVRRRLRLQEGRVQVIPNGVPLLSSRPLPEQVRRCVFVGALIPRKAADVLLEAFARVAVERPVVSLLLVGDGSERARLEERASREDLAGRVRFAGYVTDVPRHLQDAEVFVLPSLNENQPLALLEAMGAGLACIATDVGGNAQMLTPGRGTLVPPGQVAPLAEALAKVLDEPGLAAEQGRLAAEAVRASYSIGACADAHLHLYQRLVASRS